MSAHNRRARHTEILDACTAEYAKKARTIWIVCYEVLDPEEIAVELARERRPRRSDRSMRPTCVVNVLLKHILARKVCRDSTQFSRIFD